jgi:hypothetical protein
MGSLLSLLSATSLMSFALLTFGCVVGLPSQDPQLALSGGGEGKQHTLGLQGK